VKRKILKRKEKYGSETKQKGKFGEQKEVKKLMQNFCLTMRGGSETNPVSLHFALKQK
jgi:hypothetical protein